MKKRFVLRNEAAIEAAAAFVLGISPDAKRPLEVVIQPHRSRRTLEQNAKLHALLLLIADHTGDDLESVKLAMKARFLAPRAIVELPDGSKAAVYPSTATMNTAELAEFIQRIEAFAATELGIRLPAPAWWEEAA